MYMTSYDKRSFTYMNMTSYVLCQLQKSWCKIIFMTSAQSTRRSLAEYLSYLEQYFTK